jgi:hypothetical protein
MLRGRAVVVAEGRNEAVARERSSVVDPQGLSVSLSPSLSSSLSELVPKGPVEAEPGMRRGPGVVERSVAGPDVV